MIGARSAAAPRDASSKVICIQRLTVLRISSRTRPGCLSGKWMTSDQETELQSPLHPEMLFTISNLFFTAFSPLRPSQPHLVLSVAANQF